MWISQGTTQYQVLKSMKEKIPQLFTTLEITYGLRQCDEKAVLEKGNGPYLHMIGRHAATYTCKMGEPWII